MIVRARKRHPFQFLFKPILKGFLFILLFIGVSSGIHQFKTAPYFPITSVKIIGTHSIQHTALQELLTPLVKKNFFAVDVEAIKDRLLQITWVSHAIVRRVWPNELIITITEKIPFARWNETSLLSTGGELFSPEEKVSELNLPELVGPLGQHIFMQKSFAKMQNVLAPLNTRIVRLELTPALSWNITLDNGIKLGVGRKDVLTRLSHFVKVYRKIVGTRAADVEYIDLRYANGLAVRWKSLI